VKHARGFTACFCKGNACIEKHNLAAAFCARRCNGRSVYACAYDCNAFSNQLITLNCVHLNSVHRLVLPFCEAFSSPIFPTHNLGFAWGILEFKHPSNFLPKSVSSSPRFTDDFSGVTGIYELKMTPKFRVKI
jgi:hypothetical protein